MSKQWTIENDTGAELIVRAPNGFAVELDASSADPRERFAYFAIHQQASDMEQLRADLAAVVAKRDEWPDFAAWLSSQLGNLLAVIHRDGGHYESERGTEKACADAETAVHVLRGSLEGYIEANRHMKGELDDALEDARKYAEAQRDVARLRDRLDSALSQSSLFGDALHAIANRCEGMASRIARAALAQVAESRE